MHHSDVVVGRGQPVGQVARSIRRCVIDDQKLEVGELLYGRLSLDNLDESIEASDRIFVDLLDQRFGGPPPENDLHPG